MSIVKMKHLRLIGLSEERDELLGRLLHMGCVEVSEPDDKVNDPEWKALVKRDVSSLSQVKGEAAAIASALDALKKYAPEKGGLFVKRSNITEADFFNREAKASAMQSASEINACTREIAKLFSRENKLNASAASLTPWAGLDLPLEMQETNNTSLILGACPAAVELSALQGDLAQATDLAELLPVSADRDQQYFLLLSHRTATEDAMNALRPHSFSAVRFKGMTGTAQENLQRLQQEIAGIQEARQVQIDQIAAHKDCRKALQLCQDRVNQEISKELVAERFLSDGRIFFAEGWIPAEKVEEFQEMLRSFTCAWETEDPTAEETETVPIQLKNPGWMRCINMVTEMYSLPAYNGIDPNPLIFFWYVFFFGFMFADVAYGLIILIACLVIDNKFHPKGTMGYMFNLGKWLGGSTAICGFFVGGFFGNAVDVIFENFIPGGTAAMPGWLSTFSNGIVVNPIQDPLTVLIIAVVVGCVQLIMGQCIHIYMGFRDGCGPDALLDVVPWWVVFAGIGLAVVAGTPWGIVLGAVILILTQGRHEPTILKKLMGGVKSLYDITSWLSDVLSYARLMALMLATSVIAMVFNTLGALPKNIIVFIIVFVVGHVFNIGVNIIGTYVHAARLQYLEYFGKFYISGGIPFRPLQYNTKFVDIVNEEEK